MMEEEKRGLDLKSPRPHLCHSWCWPFAGGAQHCGNTFVLSGLCPFKVRAGLWVKAQEFGGPGVIEAAFEEEKRLRGGILACGALVGAHLHCSEPRT